MKRLQCRRLQKDCVAPFSSPRHVVADSREDNLAQTPHLGVVGRGHLGVERDIRIRNHNVHYNTKQQQYSERLRDCDVNIISVNGDGECCWAADEFVINTKQQQQYSWQLCGFYINKYGLASGKSLTLRHSMPRARHGFSRNKTFLKHTNGIQLYNGLGQGKVDGYGLEYDYDRDAFCVHHCVTTSWGHSKQRK